MGARDIRLRLWHLADAPRLARNERREVRRARARLPTPPEALVLTVVPTFGRDGLVQRAVASALGQTVTDHAVVVVVDGGPVPALPADPRLTVVPLTRHHGIPGLVRNVGIGVSSSSYLAFLDDDNWWEPTHLERSLAAHRGGAELTYTGMRQVRPDGSGGETIAVPFDRRALRNASFIDTSTMVVRRSPAVRFSRVKGLYEDRALAYRLSGRLRTELVPEVTVHYLLHPEGYMQRHL